MFLMSLLDRFFNSLATPTAYADRFASGAMELGEYLASSIVAFSGSMEIVTSAEIVGYWWALLSPDDCIAIFRQSPDDTLRESAERFANPLFENLPVAAQQTVVCAYQNAHRGKPSLYEDRFGMEKRGFKSAIRDLPILLEPRGHSEIVANPLYLSALRASLAFVNLLGENAALRNMETGKANEFGRALRVAVARGGSLKKCFPSDPQKALDGMAALLHSLACERILNRESHGKGDGLAALLDAAVQSADPNMYYGFVVGSDKQLTGLGSCIVRVATSIENNIQGCVQRFGWR